MTRGVLSPKFLFFQALQAEKKEAEDEMGRKEKEKEKNDEKGEAVLLEKDEEKEKESGPEEEQKEEKTEKATEEEVKALRAPRRPKTLQIKVTLLDDTLYECELDVRAFLSFYK